MTENALSDSRGRTWLPGGVVGRELRAAVPLVAILSLLPSLLPVVLWRLASWFQHDHYGAPSVTNMCGFWVVASVLTAFLLGTLCGAEEEENQTIEFVLAQPVHPLLVLAGKIAGSALAFVLWAVGSSVLCAVVALVAPRDYWPPVSFFVRGLAQLLPWWLAAFLVPLGVGVWVRKVLITAMASFLLCVICFLVAAAIFINGTKTPADRDVLAGFVFGALSLLALFSAVGRYQTRGMG